MQTERRRVYSYAEVPPSLALKLNAKVFFMSKKTYNLHLKGYVGGWRAKEAEQKAVEDAPQLSLRLVMQKKMTVPPLWGRMSRR